MIAEPAGELGRQWLPAHRSIDGADLAIANLNKVNPRDTHTRCGSTFGDPAGACGGRGCQPSHSIGDDYVKNDRLR